MQMASWRRHERRALAEIGDCPSHEEGVNHMGYSNVPSNANNLIYWCTNRANQKAPNAWMQGNSQTAKNTASSFNGIPKRRRARPQRKSPDDWLSSLSLSSSSSMNSQAPEFVPSFLRGPSVSHPSIGDATCSKQDMASSRNVSEPTITIPTELPFATEKPSTCHQQTHADEVHSDLEATLKTLFEKKLDEQDPFGALELVERRSKYLPVSSQVRLYRDILSFVKRQRMSTLVRACYSQLVRIDPYSSIHWLEFARLEEEAGHWRQSGEILHRGLQFDSENGNLLLRIIKHEDATDNVWIARTMLARVRTWPLKRSWKILLEGALLEARHQNIHVARLICKFLLIKMPTNAIVYHEACLMEEKHLHFGRALTIVMKGIKNTPMYGPLWFDLLRLEERKAMKKCLTEDCLRVVELSLVRELVFKCPDLVCKEFVWKIFFELAMMEFRMALAVQQHHGVRHDENAHLDRSREALGLAFQHCPSHLQWKVWSGGARMEVLIGTCHCVVERILSISLEQTVGTKNWLLCVLEMARFEEMRGSVAASRQILEQASYSSHTKVANEFEFGWKIAYERVLLECRCREYARALSICRLALQRYSGVGRLWCMLILLHHDAGLEAQLRVFKQALSYAPKSGEVWCEGARLYMNPFASYHSLEKAEEFLGFAAFFTPQYGDVFIELLRVMIIRWTLSKKLAARDLNKPFPPLNGGEQRRQEYRALLSKCINADPKYGRLWISFKKNYFETAKEILRQAKQTLAVDIECTWQVYATPQGSRLPIELSPSQFSSYFFTNGCLEDCVEFWGLHHHQPSRPADDAIQLVHLFEQVYAQDPIVP